MTCENLSIDKEYSPSRAAARWQRVGYSWRVS